MRDVLAGSWKMISTAWQMDWRKTALSVGLVALGALAAPLLAAALAWTISAVVARRPAEAAAAGVAVAVLAIMTLTFSHFAHVAYYDVSELAELDFDEKLVALSNGTRGIEHHEQAEYADTLTVLRQESRQFRAGLEALLLALGLVLAVVFTAVLLALQNPLFLLLPLAVLPVLVTGRAAERILDQAKTAAAESTRVALNLFHLSTTSRFAGELRVFRLQDELLRRHGEFSAAATRIIWRAYLRATWRRAAGQVVFALAYAGAVLLVIREALAGRRSVADVVLVVTLAAQVNQQVTVAVTLLQNLQRMASAYHRLSRFEESVTAAGPWRADHPLPERLQAGIELDGVSFCYPGMRVPVLREVHLTLPAGSTVAIVGENGAGKTTLINLLCGFYQPSAGSITIDGVDLRRLPIGQWRQRVAAGFQDFGRYEFIAQQTVGVGDLPQMSSEPAVRAALDRAHGADVIDQLTDGLGTQLGKSHADGVELSGGQWQKLALGRAMMRRSPLLLVLDEPTSALDSEAEHALFERYVEQAERVRRAAGAITVLVSHRFSTVAMADLIIVVAEGRVAETGDHATLVGGNGLYAELFSIQAMAYR
jgi:ATP-binding cassette subfamily B protein